MSAAWSEWVGKTSSELQIRQLFRHLRPLDIANNPAEAHVPHEDLAAWAGEQASGHALLAPPQQPRQLKLFSLNDYMGLSAHPDVRRAAAEAAAQSGMGPRSSALVAGYTRRHAELETALARLKGTEACLLFPTGFAANMGVLAALAGQPGVHVFSDELNHASIIDGARLAVRGGAGLHVYRHCDLAHLEQLLGQVPPGCRKLVVSDSLFSMDGDYADVAGLAALRQRHGFLLVLDEAHATLVAGDRGGGAAEAAGVGDQVDVHVGTLSKAFGALGGFVCCSSDMKGLLQNRARPYVFSTSLPLPVVAAAHAALHVSHREGWRRAHLRALQARVSSRLGVCADSPIIPLLVGSEGAALSLAGALLLRGFHVAAIRPPTVPPGTCRLRLSLCAADSLADVDALCDAILECGWRQPGGADSAGAGGSDSAGGGSGSVCLAPTRSTRPAGGAALGRTDSVSYRAKL